MFLLVDSSQCRVSVKEDRNFLSILYVLFLVLAQNRKELPNRYYLLIYGPVPLSADTGIESAYRYASRSGLEPYINLKS